MTKLLTISALVIMLLLQYSRQAYYLNCKMENISAASNCDCEKIMEHTGDDDHQNDQSNMHRMVAPDELFCSNFSSLTSAELTPQRQEPIAAKQDFYAQLFIKTWILPPIS